MRAKACTNFLVELNPEVQGNWYPKSEVCRYQPLDEINPSKTLTPSAIQGPFNLQQLLTNSPVFTIILYALPLPEDQTKLLHDYARQHQTPIMAVHSVGFYSYFKTTLPGSFPVVDTHPEETATTDLRLLAPWPELIDFAKDMTRNIDTLDNHEHGHLPLVVILLYHLDQWQQGHGGVYPTTYADKTIFRKTVSDAMRKDNPEGGEENFEEAVAAVMKHVTLPSIPSSLQQVFDYQHEDPVGVSFYPPSIVTH